MRCSRSCEGFPALLFTVSWGALFILDNHLDAPAIPIDDRSIADLADTANGASLALVLLRIGLGILGTALLFRNRTVISLRQKAAVPLFAYLAWICIDCLWADNPPLTLRRVAALACMLVFTAGCASRMSVRTLGVFIAAIPAANLLPGLLVELRYGTFQPFSPDFRFIGTAPHPNVQGACLAITALLLTLLAWHAERRTRTVLLALSAPVLVFLFLTNSRTSIIAMFCSFLFAAGLALLREQRQQAARFAAVVFAVLFSFTLITAAYTCLADQRDPLFFVKSDRDIGNVTTFTGRSFLWQTCLEFVADRPLTGYGYGGFWSPQHIEDISHEFGWAINQSHSAYIDLALNLGLPGALLYLLLAAAAFAVCIARFWAGKDEYLACGAILLFSFIHGATESLSLLPLFPNFAVTAILVSLALRPASSSPSQTGRLTVGSVSLTKIPIA